MLKLRIVNEFYKKNPKGFSLLVMLVSISSVFEGIGFLSILPLIEFILKDNLTSHYTIPIIGNIFSIQSDFFSIGNLLIIILTLFFLKFIFLFLALLLSAKLGSNFTNELREELFKKIIQAKYDFFTATSLGRISNSLVTEVLSVGGSYTMVVGFISSLILVLVYLFISFLTSFHLTLISILFSLMVVFMLKKINSKTKTNTQIQVSKLNEFMKQLNNSLTIVKPIKAMSQEKYFSEMIFATSRKLRDSHKHLIFLLGLIPIIQEPIFVFFIISLLSFLIIKFPQFLDVTQVIFMIVLLYRVFSKVGSLQVFYQKLGNQEVYLNSYNKLFSKANKFKELNYGDIKVNKVESIEFRNVSFKYDEKYILKKLSFVVNSKDFCCISGVSGVGKTTLIDLISGLYTNYDGKIIINKNDFKSLNLKDWRLKIGYLSQDSILFNDSVFNNVTFKDKSITKASVINALKISNIWDHISSTKNTIDSIVGERGVKLSGGQRQRINLARVLVRKPKILLLDEPTSALDQKNKIKLIESLKTLQKKIAIICVTHDKELLSLSNNVIQMKLK